MNKQSLLFNGCLAILAFGMGLNAGCGAPPADHVSVSAPPTLTLTAPEPSLLTAPPRGLTSPPRGFSALVGEILMPPDVPERFSLHNWLMPAAWALDLTQLTFRLDGQVQEVILQDQRRRPDGSSSARYYLLQAPLKAQRLESFNSNGQFALQANLAMEDQQVVAQDINIGSTALAFLKLANTQLRDFDILQGSQWGDTQRLLKDRLQAGKQITPSANPVLNEQITTMASHIPIQQAVAQLVTIGGSGKIDMNAGQMRHLPVRVQMSDGQYHTLVRWTSSNPQVAWVDAQGKLYGFSQGQTTIKAIALAAPYPQTSVLVEIQGAPQPLSTPTPTTTTTAPGATPVPTSTASPALFNGNLRLVATPKSIELRQKGEQQTITVQWDGASNNSVPIPTLRWQSSQPTQIEVNSQGIVSALVEAGEADVTVMLIDNPEVRDTVRVRVKKTGSPN